jgi:DNA-directed RNA polymerase subunit RPC12/RpoP
MQTRHTARLKIESSSSLYEPSGSMAEIKAIGAFLTAIADSRESATVSLGRHRVELVVIEEHEFVCPRCGSRRWFDPRYTYGQCATRHEAEDPALAAR